nr:peptidase M20 [Algoriphagus sp.]
MKKSAFIIILAILPFLTFAQQKLSKEEKKLLELVDKNYQETVALLEE